MARSGRTSSKSWMTSMLSQAVTILTGWSHASRRPSSRLSKPSSISRSSSKRFVIRSKPSLTTTSPPSRSRSRSTAQPVARRVPLRSLACSRTQPSLARTCEILTLDSQAQTFRERPQKLLHYSPEGAGAANTCSN